MNVMRGPSATQTDMGIFKNFRFSSDMGIQFRAEFFNVFNNVNLGGPNTDVSSGNFGRITGTQRRLRSAADPSVRVEVRVLEQEGSLTRRRRDAEVTENSFLRKKTP